MAEIERQACVRARAEFLLGRRPWHLLQRYGKVMTGPRSGMYLNSFAVEEQLAAAESLVAGRTLYVHLMHRHGIGNFESSCLRWSDGRLLMVFRDHEEVA